MMKRETEAGETRSRTIWRGAVEFCRFQRVPAAILAAIFLVRLPAGLWVVTHSRDFFLHDDGREYAEVARSVATGHGFRKVEVAWYEAPRDRPIPEAYRPLLLPLLGGVFLTVAPDSLVPLFLLQSLLYIALVAMMTKMAADWFGERSGWLAGLLTACHPLILVFSFRFSTELLFCLTLLAFVACWWRVEDTRGYFRLGVVAALATYARPSGLALLPFSLAALLLRFRGRGMRGAAAFLMAFLVALSPVAVRNYVHFGVPSLTPFNAGYTFWIGNHPAMLEGYRAASGVGFLERQDEAWLDGIRVTKQMPSAIRLAPPKQSRYWLERGLAHLRVMGVSDSLELLAWRAWHFLRPWPTHGAHPELVFWVVTLVEVGLFVAGLAGLVTTASRDARRLVPFLVVFAAGASVHTVFFALMRYRVPFLDLGLILLASGWAAGWLAGPGAGSERRGRLITRPGRASTPPCAPAPRRR